MFNSDLKFKGWSLKQIVHPIANEFLLKPEQGSDQIGLQNLLSKLHDMITPSLKIEEIIAFQIELIVKRNWKICQALRIGGCLALFGPPKQVLNELKNLCQFLYLETRLQITTFVFGANVQFSLT